MSTPPPYRPPMGQGPFRPALNGFALASLLVGLLCLPPLGIVFGVVALVQIARKGERGRALAVVGLVVSVAMTAVLVLGAGRYGGTVLGRLGPAREPVRVEGELTGIDELRAGDCFNVPGGDLLEEDPFIHRIDCGRVHDAEVTSTSPLALTGSPGTTQLKEAAAQACWKAQDAYAMDTWALPPYAEMFYFAPTGETWRDGDHGLLCVIGTPDREHRGSLRKDSGTLTADQVALLGVLNGTDQVLGDGPRRELGVALAEYRSWAREVDGALGAEAGLLRGVVSRPGVGPAAQALLKEVEAARGQWQRAARAGKAEEFRRAWDAALGATTIDTEKALRGAYGLSTRVPDWLEEFPGDSDGGSGSGSRSESVGYPVGNAR
ncbi:DUF4190 domain-containing protein [Streptomyces lavendulae]|uniref:DUF4190 domain-containing protein n=1 Tax=Streptomyces lavendulae TaxID=1914 RepID=UPI0024A27A0A|nr:membrane protein [Streptomyces roseochromogenus]